MTHALPAIRLAWGLGVFAIAAPLSLIAQNSRTSVVIAGVADATTGAPLENAEVRVVDANISGRTDWNGEVRIPYVTPGKHQFEVRHPGYSVLNVDLLVQGDSTGPVFRLASTNPVPELEPVTVNGQPTPSSLKAFEARRAQGLGKFLTADQLEVAEQTNQALMSIVVHAFNGLMSAQDPEHTGRDILMTRRANARLEQNDLPLEMHYISESHCGVDVYLDGTQYKDDLDAIRPEQLAGVEYYPMSAAPGEYRRLSSSCGVLLLWSKR
ncbi:MAG: carboxypeptidase regulatory-like domain-containing protein [Gemmatimonadaceae bacterium]